MRLLLWAALLPTFLLMIYVYSKDRGDKEPLGLLALLLAAGALCSIPAAFIEGVLGGVAEAFLSGEALAMADAFLIVAVAEEGCKLAALRLITWRNKEFNYTFDGIVYSAAVSLGFAGLENILYLMSYGIEIAPVRGVLSVPGHLAFSVFMGFFYSEAKKADGLGYAGGVRKNMRRAFIIPVLAHGFFDFCLMSENEFLSLFFFVFVLVVDLIVLRLIRKSSREDQMI